MRQRVQILILVALLIAGVHWLVPGEPGWLHAVHVLMRKLLLVPVVLAAVWFGLRGGLLAAAAVSVLYAPHVLVQWAGQMGENLNQAGELVTLWTIAALAGLLVGRERRAVHQVGEANRSTLQALLKALDVREHRTEQHAQRVGAYARRIGEEMGLAAGALETLKQVAVLHDVGKIGVPDRILLKPGELSTDEWRMMQTHAALGGEILAATPSLRGLAKIVRAHHEWYDGTGYPDGLRGEKIPLPARIFAVADVFDALTSERPYRRPLPWHEAQAYIRRQSHRQFDPRVVQAFRQVPLAQWADLAERAVAGRPSAPSFPTTPSATTSHV